MAVVDISEIRAAVLSGNPFWGYLLAQTPVKVMKTAVGTSFTDGKRIVLHEEQMTDEKTAKVLIHELAHIAYMHVARRKEYYSRAIGEDIPDLVANLGEDVVANSAVVDIFGEEIKDAAVRVPLGSAGNWAEIRIAGQRRVVQFPRAIREMTTEEIVKHVWDALKDLFGSGSKGSGKGEKEGKNTGSGKGEKEDGDGVKVEGWADDHSKHGEISDADADEIRQRVQKAAEYAKSRGALPAGIEDVVEAAKPKIVVDWRMFVKKWIQETWGSDDYTWKRPNKRKMAATGVYLPRTVGHRGEAWIVLDTSGSMMGDDIKKAVGAIQAGMIRNGVDVANIVQIDAEIERVDRVRAKDLKRYTVRGMGGTVLRPAIEYAVKHGAKGVIVVTDGYIDDGDLEGWRIPILVMVTDQGGYERVREHAKRNVKVVMVE